MVTKHLLDPMQSQLDPVAAELESLTSGLRPASAQAGGAAEPRPEADQPASTVAFDPEAT